MWAWTEYQLISVRSTSLWINQNLKHFKKYKYFSVSQIFIDDLFTIILMLLNHLSTCSKKAKQIKKIRFFTFIKKIQKAFAKLKKIFETAFLLMYFNFWREMQIKTNASEIVIKTIFSQWVSDEKFLKIKIEMTSN